jgi:murein DD-endopeptidase MepM/ murein hydrolase activator NlpD
MRRMAVIMRLGRSGLVVVSPLLALSGGLGWGVWIGGMGGGQAVWAVEGTMGEEAPPRKEATRSAQPREAEVSDLGRNSALPEALRPVFFPVPPDFAERAPVGGRLTAGRLKESEGARGGLPSLGYPINQAPIEVSPFGMRWSEARGAWRMHTGMDLIVTEGTPVLASAAGRVVLVDEVSGYGLTVLVDHGDGWQTLYAHLFEIAVQPGEPVQRGQPLGRVGDSGRASTPHLHFEIRQRRGERVLALDPGPILRHREPGAIVQRP